MLCIFIWYRCYCCWLHFLLWIILFAIEHTVSIVPVPLICHLEFRVVMPCTHCFNSRVKRPGIAGKPCCWRQYLAGEPCAVSRSGNHTSHCQEFRSTQKLIWLFFAVVIGDEVHSFCAMLSFVLLFGTLLNSYIIPIFSL